VNAGSSSQKSCLYEFRAETLAAPSRPLWEAEIDFKHHKGLAELKVATAHGVSLEETLKSESRSEATAHMLRALWSGKTKVIAQLSDIDVVGHRVVHGGLEFEQSTQVAIKDLGSSSWRCTDDMLSEAVFERLREIDYKNG
jgi:acetate kinase